MSFSAGSITGDISLNDAPAVAAFKHVEKSAVDFKRNTDGIMGQAGVSASQGFLKGISSELGKKSLLGQFTKLAMGGGAIAGVTMLGHALASSTGEIKDLVGALREGELGVGDFTEKLAGALPVVGPLWQAGRNIREMFTGEKAEIAQLNGEVKLTNSLYDDQAHRVVMLKSAVEGYVASIAQLKGELRLVQASDPVASVIIGLRNSQEKQWEDDKNQLKAQISAAQLMTKKLSDDQGAIVENKRAEFNKKYPLFEGMTFEQVRNLRASEWGQQHITRDVEIDFQELTVAEDKRAKIVQQGEKDIAKIKDDARLRESAADEVFNAKILKAQQEAGRVLEGEINAGIADAEALYERKRDSIFKERESLQREYAAAAQQSQEHQMQSLPINKAVAREFFGGYVVTSADMPAGKVETLESARRTAKAAEKTNDLLGQLIELWRNQHPGQDVPSVENLTLEDWGL